MNKTLVTSLEDLEKFLIPHQQMMRLILVREPLIYPAVLVWKETMEDGSSCIDGDYVYINDFKRKKNNKKVSF